MNINYTVWCMYVCVNDDKMQCNAMQVMLLMIIIIVFAITVTTNAWKRQKKNEMNMCCSQNIHNAMRVRKGKKKEEGFMKKKTTFEQKNVVTVT